MAAIRSVVAVLMTPPAVGCGEYAGTGGPKAAPSLIMIDSRTHRFPPVIGGPGRALTHRYRLANATNAVVQIVEVDNRKPCCGSIVVGAETLAPGAATFVEVTMLVGGKFGEVVHEARVVTVPPDAGEDVLRSIAEVYPRIRIEPAERPGAADPGGSTLDAYRVAATGDPAEPIIDLDAVDLVSTAPARWSAAKETITASGGLRSRHALSWRRWDEAGSRGRGPRRSS